MNRVDAARVLELAPSAGPRDIEAAFRRHAQRTHPDAGGDPAMFDQAVLARQTLLTTTAPPRDTTWAISSAQLRRKHRDQVRRRWLNRLRLDTTQDNPRVR